MRAQSAEELLQGVRRGEHLPAPSEKEHVQGVRRGGHLPARSDKEPMQDVQGRQGRVDAAGSRGALNFTHAFCCVSRFFHLGQSSLIVFHARLNDKHRIGHFADMSQRTKGSIPSCFAMSTSP